MSIPTPKYQIGDVVWRGTSEGTTEQLPCPDCLGTKKWKVITPAGTELETGCIRCGRGHSYIRTPSHEDIPSLMVRKFVPCTKQLTIGSVRIDTYDGHPVTYMCRETGVGSGSIYHECDLHETEEAAYQFAVSDAASRTEELAGEPRQIVAHKLGALIVDVAARQADWNAVYNAWDVARWHRETLDSICGEEDKHLYSNMEEIREYAQVRLNELQRYKFIDRHPFETLLAAARVSSDPAVRAVVEEIDVKFPSGDDEVKAEVEEVL